MEPRLTMVTLGVEDLAASRAFYQRLGWTASSAGNEHVAFFQLGPLVLGLYGARALAEDAQVPFDPGTFDRVTLAYNVGSPAEVDAVLAEAEAAGARILKPGQEVFWGGYSGYFADPDGHAWEVAWNPIMPLDVDGVMRLPE
ncbi:MAG: VOC family protein [Hyphomicrobiales bacterium]|nr:VOC family protein [Hyphomicrobiales bacterium]MCP5371057.1 VOC family protein [Hyphomicrobiales bacterium]